MALSAGDIGFVQYNSDNPDNFAFVALVDILPGEVINFTDNGWLAAGGFRTGEETLEWTSDGVAAGTVVTIAGSVAIGGGTVTAGSQPAFTVAGDQVIAFQGTLAAPTPIAALHMNGSFDPDASSTNTSALPTGLIEGTNAVAIDPELDNAAYAGITTGDQATLLAALFDPANWTTSNTVVQTYAGGPFSVIGEATVTSAEYDPVTGALLVTGENLVNVLGDDIDASAFSVELLTGGSYTLTDTADVEISSATVFTLTLSATDKAGVDALLDRDGNESSVGLTYNLAAATTFNGNAPADLTGNTILVSGNDDLFLATSPTESFDGFAGNDTVSYADGTGPVLADLDPSQAG